MSKTLINPSTELATTLKSLMATFVTESLKSLRTWTGWEFLVARRSHSLTVASKLAEARISYYYVGDEVIGYKDTEFTWD